MVFILATIIPVAAYIKNLYIQKNFIILMNKSSTAAYLKGVCKF